MLDSAASLFAVFMVGVLAILLLGLFGDSMVAHVPGFMGFFDNAVQQLVGALGRIVNYHG